MVRRAFPAEVTNGQLRFQESLADLEGRRVLVVLDDCEAPLPTTNSSPRLTPDPVSAEEFVPEYDLNFERPFRRKKVVGTVYDGGRLRPTLILPEELPEEDGDE